MELIQLIESKYEVDKIRAHGHQVWPLIRFSLSAYFQSQIQPFHDRSLSIRKVFELATQFFYGFHFYFKKYKYLAISDSSERKLIDGRWVDKSVDYFIENLPSTLLIELPLPRHYKKSQVATKFIASKLPLYVFERLYTSIFVRQIKI